MTTTRSVSCWLELRFSAHIRAQGEESKALKPEAGFKARRWVVERTHRRMYRFRRVLIRWDKNVRNDLAFLPMACALHAAQASRLLEKVVDSPGLPGDAE